MAIVRVSVPDEIKREFDEEFGDAEKGTTIAELMGRAVRERQLQRQRQKVFVELNENRTHRASATAEHVRDARNTDRSWVDKIC